MITLFDLSLHQVIKWRSSAKKQPNKQPGIESQNDALEWTRDFTVRENIPEAWRAMEHRTPPVQSKVRPRTSLHRDHQRVPSADWHRPSKWRGKAEDKEPTVNVQSRSNEDTAPVGPRHGVQAHDQVVSRLASLLQRFYEVPAERWCWRECCLYFNLPLENH